MQKVPKSESCSDPLHVGMPRRQASTSAQVGGSRTNRFHRERAVMSFLDKVARIRAELIGAASDMPAAPVEPVEPVEHE